MIAGIAFAAFAIFGCAGAARADQVFCDATVTSVVSRTPTAPGTTYDLVLATRGAPNLTSATVTVLEDNREYTARVPLRATTGVASGFGAAAKPFAPIALQFANPVSVQAAWIQDVTDDRGIKATCFANATVPTARDASATVKPIVVKVPVQAGVPFITPENCAEKYQDPIATFPVVPEYPDAAKRKLLPDLTSVARVDIKPDGEIAGVVVVQSSGVSELDDATIRAVRNSKFSPKKVECIPFAGSYFFRATFAQHG